MFNFGIYELIFYKSTIVIIFIIVNTTISTIGIVKFSLSLSSSTVFFYVGLNFVLIGVQEQRDLMPSQFCRVLQDRSVYNTKVYYQYIELDIGKQ